MSNRANRVKAIFQDLGSRLGTNEENERTLKKFLDDNGYKGINNINLIKNWYDDLKINFKVRLTDNVNLDSKLNELLL